MSFFDVSGVPSEFGISLLTLSLILSLSPYFSGIDFGIIKIPKLKVRAQKVLKIIGPLILLLSFLSFLPIWSQFFRVTLFPLLNSSTSPIVGQSLRIGISQTNYRIEITIKNTNIRDDRLINHINIYASDSYTQCLSFPSYFTVSDSLIVQPTSDDNRLIIQGEINQDQDTDFAYKLDGIFEIGACGEETFMLGFDTSIVIPKNSSVQFYVLLPRNINIINDASSPDDNLSMTSLLETASKDILKSHPIVQIAIWDSESEKPIIFGQEQHETK